MTCASNATANASSAREAPGLRNALRSPNDVGIAPDLDGPSELARAVVPQTTKMSLAASVVPVPKLATKTAAPTSLPSAS